MLYSYAHWMWGEAVGLLCVAVAVWQLCQPRVTVTVAPGCRDNPTEERNRRLERNRGLSPFSLPTTQALQSRPTTWHSILCLNRRLRDTSLRQSDIEDVRLTRDVDRLGIQHPIVQRHLDPVCPAMEYRNRVATVI